MKGPAGSLLPLFSSLDLDSQRKRKCHGVERIIRDKKGRKGRKEGQQEVRKEGKKRETDRKQRIRKLRFQEGQGHSKHVDNLLKINHNGKEYVKKIYTYN